MPCVMAIPLNILIAVRVPNVWVQLINISIVAALVVVIIQGVGLMIKIIKERRRIGALIKKFTA